MAQLSETGGEESNSRGPRAGAVDVHVGNRIKLRRMLLGMSQERLGEALGLTFQQVQKYERGVNRVSASRLFDIARVLDVPVGFFYDDLDPELGGARYGAGYSASLVSLASSRVARGFAEGQQAFGAPSPAQHAGAAETGELLASFARIADPAMRQHVIALVKGIAG